MESLNPVNAPVGTRAIVTSETLLGAPIYEIEVLEWSPSNSHLKLKYLSGIPQWMQVEAAPILVEVLLPGHMPTIEGSGLGNHPVSIPLEVAFPQTAD